MAKNNKSISEESSAVHYSANTCGCSLESLPHLISRRAYQLFEMRGRQPGHELDDWLQAEREEKERLGI